MAPLKSPRICGYHDPGGEHVAYDLGMSGWVLYTHALGHDPADNSGYDYWHSFDMGHTVIARLNNGYYPNGTIPQMGQYVPFSRRCANWVAASHHCHLWVIGNEMNHEQERPEGESIYPEEYACCYRLCRYAIRNVPGHEDDEVLVGAVAPWNVQTAYTGNPSGYWLAYQHDILESLGPDNCDGITIHAYTHGTHPDLIYSDAKMGKPFEDDHYNFKVYRDLMRAIPHDMRHLPVYLTEADQDEPWADVNSGWVKNAYGEIDHWNHQPGNQKILCMLLYRWQRGHDRWGIEGKDGVIADYRDAVQQGYTWETA